MHYGIFTIGSRGDVQPYIALSLALMERGHTVTLGAPENFKHFVESFGIPFHSLHGDIEKVVNSEEGLRLLRSRSNWQLLKFFQQEGHKMRHQVRADLLEGCKKAEILIASYLTSHAISVIAEKLGKKWAFVNLNPPMLLTAETPALPLAFNPFPFLNRLTYRLVDVVEWAVNKADFQEHRAELGLPPLKGSFSNDLLRKKIPVVNAISSCFLKRPKDWPSHYSVTGFLSLSEKRLNTFENDQVPAGLQQWLSEGPRPIYIGFGSIPFPDKELFLATLKELLESTDLRFIFCRGWFKVDQLPRDPRLFVLQSVNQAWLFPKCKAALIHGGIGTLTAVLKAGIPPVVISIFADQPYWGELVARKQLGEHLPWNKMSCKTIIKKLEKISAPQVLSHVKEMAPQLKEEKGIEKTIMELEKLVRA